MKKITRLIATLLTLTLTLGLFVGCKETPKEKKPVVSVATVNGVAIPDCIFINYFLGESSKELGKEDSKVDTTASGDKIYAQLEELGLLQTMIDNSLEEARLFMVEYELCRANEDWLNESEMAEMEKTSKEYIEELNSTYGSYYGTSSLEEFANYAYSMTYDDLVEFFQMTGALEKYKVSLEDSMKVSDDELKAYYDENSEKFYTVEVRHSLIKYEDATDKENVAEVKAEAQELVDKYNSGKLTFDEIVKMSDDVDEDGKVNNDGYYTVYQGAGFVESFEDWATAQKEASDKIAVVESEYGCHIMQCTKVLTLEDKEVKDRVSDEYKSESVSTKIEKDVEAAAAKSEYQLKDYNEEHTKALAKRTFTGEFEDEKTEPKEYNDAPMDKTVVAKYKEEDIYQSYYRQYFSQAINESFASYDSSKLSEIEDENEYYEALTKALDEEYKDGKSYIEYSKEYALELLLEFMAAKELAVEAKFTYTDEEKAEMLAELDAQIDEMLSYYGEYYGFETRDELIEDMTGSNVNGYKDMYINQEMVAEYKADAISKMKTEDKVINDYYYANENDYKIITIRTIKKKFFDEEGNRFDDKTIKQSENLLYSLMDKIKNGDSAAALVETYSDSADLSKYGLQDLQKTEYPLEEKIFEWAFKQTKIGEMAVIEESDSLNLVIIEGITNIEKTIGVVADSEATTPKAVKEKVTADYNSSAFDKNIEKYITDNKLELTDIDYDVIENIVKEYMDFNTGKSEEESKDESKEDSKDESEKESNTATDESKTTANSK